MDLEVEHVDLAVDLFDRKQEKLLQMYVEANLLWQQIKELRAMAPDVYEEIAKRGLDGRYLGRNDVLTKFARELATLPGHSASALGWEIKYAK